MKKHIYGSGVVALALALALVMGAVPAISFAQDSVSADGQGNVAPTAQSPFGERQVQLGGVKPPVQAEAARQLLEQKAEKAREALAARRQGVASSSVANARELFIAHEQMMASSSERRDGEHATGTMPVRAEIAHILNQQIRPELRLLLSGSTTPAQNVEQLKQVIEERRQTIEQELASTSPVRAAVFERAAKVSVAVHALLAAQDLLGNGIGDQVSQIAQQVNDSLATTTSAEAQIQSRGFFARLFFGGDKQAADAIKQQVDQNQSRVQELTGLLSSASTTEDVKAALDAQIQAMKDEQARLQSVAQSQSKLWGLFSWRLF